MFVLAAKLYGLTLLTDSCKPTIQRKHIVAFPLLKQLTLTCHRVLFTYTVYRVGSRNVIKAFVIHNIPPQYPVLRQMNLLHLSNSVSLVSILILSPYLLPFLATDFLPSSLLLISRNSLCVLFDIICDNQKSCFWLSYMYDFQIS